MNRSIDPITKIAVFASLVTFKISVFFNKCRTNISIECEYYCKTMRDLPIYSQLFLTITITKAGLHR